MLKKAIFAGYPYNGEGYLNELYDMLGDEFGDYYSLEITKSAVWTLMSYWGVPGNEPIDVDPREIECFEYDLFDNIVQNIVKYALDGSEMNAPISTNVTFGQSKIGEFVQDSDNEWKTGEIAIDNPDGWVVTYTLNLPEGVTAKDVQGNTITEVVGGTPFTLTTSNPDSITDDSVLSASASVTYPDTLYQYNTSSIGNKLIDGAPSVATPYQTLVAADVNKVDLSGSLKLSVKDEEDPGTDPGTDPDNPGGNPDGGDPDGGNPDGGNPDGGNPDGGDPDGGNPDGGNPDGGNPDGGDPDGGDPDGGNPDGGNPDGGNPGGGNPDGGNPDGGNPDGGNPGGDNPDPGTTPDDGTTPDNGDNGDADDNTDNAVKTEDNTPLAPAAGFLLASVIGLVALARTRKTAK